MVGLKYSVRYPNGSFDEGSWDGNFKNGNTPLVWVNTSSTGTLIVSVYDFSNKFLGSKSVTVTSY